MGEPCNWKCARKRYCNLELLRLTISRWPAVPCALLLLVPSRFSRRLLDHETLQMSRTFVAFIQKSLGIYLSIDTWIYFTAPPPQISIKIAQTVTPPRSPWISSFISLNLSHSSKVNCGNVYFLPPFILTGSSRIESWEKHVSPLIYIVNFEI